MCEIQQTQSLREVFCLLLLKGEGKHPRILYYGKSLKDQQEPLWVDEASTF